MNDEEMVFDMIGVDPAIANALRRIILAEVPTVAIERVYINENTSVIQDEVLAHRLGLIPIKADPRQFEFVTESVADNVQNANQNLNDANTVLFNLNVACTEKPGAVVTDSEDVRYVHARVFSGDLQFMPQGSQAEKYKDQPIRPVFEDILIAKLRPGQAIDATCYCFKGRGKDHAKYSPVATASYRLLPEIVLKENLTGKLAQELKQKCPMGVFDIEDSDDILRVVRPRNCTMCRECIRDPEWEKRVDLKRVKNYYIFSIESVGMYHPKDIFEEAIKILLEKVEELKKSIERKSGKVIKTNKKSQQSQEKPEKQDKSEPEKMDQTDG